MVVERDEDGYHVASVPELPSCHTQAKTLDELTERMKEAIEAFWKLRGIDQERALNLSVFSSSRSRSIGGLPAAGKAN